MFRTVPALALMLAVLAVPVSAQVTDDQKTIARLYAGTQYFLKKADPDKARRYAQSMYLLLADKEANYGSEYADRLFYEATGMEGNRRAFFRSMDVVEHDGSLSSIPQELEKKSYSCRRQYDGSVACSEN